MAFFKRTFAKRFDLLFRRKRRGKFVECVHKVIEARRSGCIDEDGNILKPLTEMLAAHEKLNTQGAGSNAPTESVSEEALKVEPRNRHRPLARQQVVSIRDSYPLPEEDDGSEGYASAGETDDSFNPTAFLERNRRTNSRRFSNNSDEGSHGANRRVRFSDEVQQFGGLDSEDVQEEPTPAPPAEPEEPAEEPDLSSLPLVRKIKYFEEVMTRLKEERLRNRKLDGTTDQPPSPCPGSPEIRHRVKLFEDISRGIRSDPPPHHKPRRAVQSCQYTQTKSKIHFFEQLSHEV